MRLLVVLLLLLLSGCSLYNTPLPGGADIGDHPYRVTVQFGDVLDHRPASRSTTWLSGGSRRSS
jgi:phospholipid/cholesterol/gamma-HCH transport system substrate-binding protein